MEELQEVPFISNSKVLNRLILYSNQILNTKIGKENLCLTTKNNVSKYSLEYEIENTIKNNIDVVFHTIQYDEKKKRKTNKIYKRIFYRRIL